MKNIYLCFVQFFLTELIRSLLERIGFRELNFDFVAVCTWQNALMITQNKEIK